MPWTDDMEHMLRPAGQVEGQLGGRRPWLSQVRLSFGQFSCSSTNDVSYARELPCSQSDRYLGGDLLEIRPDDLGLVCFYDAKTMRLTYKVLLPERAT